MPLKGDSVMGLDVLITLSEQRPTPPSLDSASDTSDRCSGSGRSVTELAFFPPVNSGLYRRLQATLDNDLFIYPLALENFEHRNLCLKIQLVEITTAVGSDITMVASDIKVLKHVYTSVFGSNNSFNSVALSSTSYHNKSPTFAEEVRVMLPDVIISDRHFLQFTVEHIHVKAKPAGGGKGVFGGVFGSAEPVSSDVCTTIGVGLLPLLQKEGHFLPDFEYEIPILSAETSVSSSVTRTYRSDTVEALRGFVGSSTVSAVPILRVSTRCMSALQSMCPWVQALMQQCVPRPLGRLLGSRIDPVRTTQHTTELLQLPAPNINLLTNAVKGLRVASTQQIITHFRVIIRILNRVLCGGNGIYSEGFSDPFAHSTLRCHAFLDLLHLFGCIVPELSDTNTVNTNTHSVSNSNISKDEESDTLTETNLLQAFTEFFFTEELPINLHESYTSTTVSRPDANTCMSSLSFINPSSVAVDGNNRFKYLSYVSDHFASEMEKVLIEEEIDRAVNQLVEECILNASATTPTVSLKSVSPTRESRKYLNTASMKSNSTLSLVRSKQTMASLNNKYKAVSKPAKMNSRPNSVSNELSLPPFQYKDNRVTTAEQLTHHQSTSSDPLVSPTDLQTLRVRIRPPRPCYSSLEGYPARKSTLQNDGHTKWWPWMYEVLAHQFLCLLLSSAGEVSMSIPGHTPVTAESVVYPINSQAIPKSDVPSKDIKHLAIDHVSTLLSMIHKSLLLRITYEKKSAPIVLDTQSLFVFEQLLAALAKETRHRSTSLTRDRLLTCAVSEFLRSLFAVFIPAHVALLIASFYSNLSAAYRKEDCIELRLLLCEKLSTIDHFIYVNNSASLDQISSLNVSVDSDPLHEPSICSSRFRSLCINSDTAIDPPVNWLSNLFMHVSFNAYRHDDRTMHMQEKALQLMRSLLVQQSCDLRYQNPIVVQQVACLYLPLLVEVLKETYHLASKQYDSVERKERLPLLLHLLENVPSHVLRSEIRLFCLEQYRFIPSESMQSGMRDGVNSRPMSMTLQPVVSPRFACVTSDTSLASKLPADLKGTPQSDIVGVDVNKAQPMIILLLVLLNSVIDTFEYQSYTPLVVCSKRDDGTNAKLRNLSTAGATNKGTGFDFSTRLNRLESLLNKRDRKSSGSASNRSAVSTTTAADIGEDTDLKSSITKELTNTSSPMPEQRKWFKHKEALGTKLSGLAGRSNEIDHELYKSSLTLLSHTSSAIIARTVALILDECQFSQIQPSVNASDRSLIMPLSLDTPRTMTLKVVRYSLFTALHGLYCHQTVGSVISFLHIPRQVLRVYGVEIFLSAVGDTLQDWVRVLFRCFSYSQIEVTNTACELIVLLLSSCYRLYGSTTRIADVLKAVLFDSIEAIIDVYHNTTESIAEEDKLLDPILQAILTLQQNSKSILESVIASNSDTSISSQRQCNSSLVTSQETEMIMATARELETLFHAITQLRHHLMTPVAYLWEGGSGLDIALKRGSQRRSRLRKSSVASLLSTTTTSSPLVADMDAVAESFLAASNVFDPIRLPRLRIFWLEQLVRLHESLRTRGDLAEARWRIYEVMLKVENHWESTWALRKPLSWRKGSKSVEEVSPENSPDRRKVAPPRTPSPGSSPTKRLSTASPASPVIAAPTTSDRTLAMASSQNPRNFLGLLFQTVNMPSAKPWADKAQFYTHMEQTLTACKVHLCNIGLSYLAERSTFALVDLNRKTIQVRKIAEEYATLAASFQATSDSGNSNFGMGTFYWVQFIGQGIPVQLRHEFIYRNSMNLHVSEVHSEFKRLIEASVSPGIEVKVASQLLPSTADIDSEHAIIFITSVKPVYLPATPTNRYALNQTKEFQLSVPFTKTGTKSHAKSMNEQWKRTITFSVSEPFPYICGRQKVCLQTSRELSPIEAAIDDIEDRISDFKQELSGALVQNNIMRLVQGSVMPQVNAGAGEVAKVFLRKYDSTSEISMEHANGSGVDDSAYNVSSQAQLQLVLKVITYLLIFTDKFICIYMYSFLCIYSGNLTRIFALVSHFIKEMSRSDETRYDSDRW